MAERDSNSPREVWLGPPRWYRREYSSYFAPLVGMAVVCLLLLAIVSGSWREAEIGVGSYDRFSASQVTYLPNARDMVQQSGMQEMPSGSAGAVVQRKSELVVSAPEFQHARNVLEAIRRNRPGQIDSLNFAAAGAGIREVSLSLRSPAGDAEEILSRLRKLGTVVQESDVVQDLPASQELPEAKFAKQAQLSDARAAEQRLHSLLGAPGAKVLDLLEVEERIESVRAEIRKLEAGLRSFGRAPRVATISLTLRGQQVAPPPTVGDRLWAAGGSGYDTLAQAVLALIFAALHAGPLLIFWALLLYFPVKYGWRFWRRLKPAHESAASPQAV